MALSYKRIEPSRFNPRGAHKRFKTDHSILGALDQTGVTPFGRGKTKTSLELQFNWEDYKNRNDNCTGCPVRHFKIKTMEKASLVASEQQRTNVIFARAEESLGYALGVSVFFVSTKTEVKKYLNVSKTQMRVQLFVVASLFSPIYPEAMCLPFTLTWV